MILMPLQTNEALRLASHLPMRYGLLKLWVTRLLNYEDKITKTKVIRRTTKILKQRKIDS